MNAHVGRIESGEKVLRLAGRAFVADHSGALFCPEERLLLVADLHLEKGLVLRGATRVSAALRHQRRRWRGSPPSSRGWRRSGSIALGDSFHDGERRGAG